jgi:hypothetical protein
MKPIKSIQNQSFKNIEIISRWLLYRW